MKIEILDSKKKIGFLFLKGIWMCSLIGLAIAVFMAIKYYFTGLAGEDFGKQIFYVEVWFIVSTLLGIGVVLTHRYANKVVKHILRMVGIIYGVCTGILLRDITNKHASGIDWGDLTMEWYNIGTVCVVIIALLFTYHWVYIRIKE
ncbi:hypothetical protein [uncultured Sanguibacteroides sp.]|uniref:hypothetical protein n=1 Tax=uncultured Sanguibacteroides sp. TaxID=1635151 RepID=UPI0025F21B1D|nr:hypothetical protein [uncultured Sanguibacteroides sp.]